MEEDFHNIIPEYGQFKHLHTLMELKTIYHIRTTLLGSALQEAHDRISSGRYNNIDELVELRNVVPIGNERLQDLKEIQKIVEEEYRELVYLLN
jgi:hypothetical protein